MIGSESSTLRSELAHRAASYFLEELIGAGRNVVVEEIFREPFYRQIQAILRAHGCRVLMVFLTANESILVARDAGRAKTKGRAVVTRLHEQIRPLGEELVIDTATSSVEETVRTIAGRLKAA